MPRVPSPKNLTQWPAEYRRQAGETPEQTRQRVKLASKNKEN